MVVACRTENNGLILGDTLDLVSPLSRDFDGGLACLGAGARREDPIVAKSFGHHLGKLGVYIVVKGAGGEGQSGRLFA